MRLLNALAVLLCSCSIAFGQTLQPKPLTVEGTPGVWFPATDAEKLLDLATRKMPAATRVIKTQEQLLAAQQLQIKTATTTLALTNVALQQERELSLAYKAAFEKQTSTIQSPELWLVLGVVLGGVTAGLTAWQVAK